MSKYKVGDKVILTVTGMTEMGNYPHYVLNDNFYVLKQSIDEYAEPLHTYTEPLERKNAIKQKQIKKLVDRLHRQAAEITRLLAENKELKEESKRNYIVNIEMAKAEGHSEAWELAKKIYLSEEEGGYDGAELFEIFDEASLSDIYRLSYSEATAKVAEWEKAKEEIKDGDVLEGIYDNEVKCIVTNLCPDNMAYLVFDDGTAGVYELDNLKKTGRHIDIDSFLKQIGGEQEWQK